MQKHLIRCIFLSTWMRAAAIFFVVASSWGNICCPPLRNGGISKRTPRDTSRCCISKPLSAMTESPRSSFSRRPLCRAMARSDIAPSNTRDTKVTWLWGAIPIRLFNSVVIFIGWPSSAFSDKWGTNINEEFCTINNYTSGWIELFKGRRHELVNFPSRKPCW